MYVKFFQKAALTSFDLYLDELLRSRTQYEKIALLRADDPDNDLPDFPAKAYKALKDNGQIGRPNAYSPRKDGCGRPVPNATLKVPTGGGKTYLACACAAKLVTRYLQTADPRFILWIVPNEAIYSQTKKRLSNREDPYRQILDQSAAGNVKILEKDSPLHADDVKANLCVMLLMLPSANRETKAQLRMFRDRGNVNGFLPPEDDTPAHVALHKQIPNLDYTRQGEMGFGADSNSVAVVRSSLGNALRIIRPLIVMDEGQKAFSDLAHKTLYDFNPSFVLELSATPKDRQDRWANWLVNISGEQLHQEEMIKMPMEVTVSSDPDWKSCLRDAWQKTEALRHEADEYRADTQTYIRPILLVQVERVGKDQHESGLIHADEARTYLISLGLSEDAVAIKTSDQNDLKNPENQNLLAPGCPVRVIITKQALQEGWDCPFAYVLCSLAVSHSTSAMTQLVGRVLRQPYAARTGREPLDRCYVFTHQAKTGAVVQAIKDGLEKDGMGDLADKVLSSGGSVAHETMVRYRRDTWKERSYYLPEVKVAVLQDTVRDLDWDTDILGEVDWLSIPSEADGRLLTKGQAQEGKSSFVVGMDVIQTRTYSDLQTVTMDYGAFDRSFAVRSFSGIVNNPWIAGLVVERFIAGMTEIGWTEQELADQQSYVIDSMLSAVKKRLEVQAEAIFDQGLKEHRIRFHLTTTAWDWEVPKEETVAKSQSSRLRDDGKPFQTNLFDPIYDNEMNTLEYSVACFLDKQQAVSWWYRNVVRGQAYGLQGWRKNRIYPDFVIAQEKNGSVERWLVLETKGSQLVGNLDSNYKAALMDRLTNAYADQRDFVVGDILIQEGRAEYRCSLVAEENWESTLNSVIA